MANLVETASFDDGIYRIETTDAVVGGESGIANKAAKGLANRTKWLKAAIDAINIILEGLGSAATKVASASFATGTVPLWDGVYTKEEVDSRIAASPVDNHQEAIGVSTITGSGSKANMADMSITFTPKGKHILIMFSASIITNELIQDCALYINVEGTDISSQKCTIHQWEIAMSMQKLHTVTPGASINVKMMWNANSDIQQRGSISPRVFTIIDLP